MTFKDSVAVITGASSGIGKAISELFARQGAKVAGVVKQHNEEADLLAEMLHPYGGQTFQCDVSEELQVKRAVDEILETFGKINFLINSAGIIGPAIPIDNMPLSDWDRVFNVNVRGTFLFCKHCIPAMLNQQGGNIINLSSTAGFRASRISPCYSATKGAILALTRTLALMYAKNGIRINCISPGTIDTPMSNNFFDQEKDTGRREELRARFAERHPLGRFGTAAEVAAGAVFLASESSSFVTGINLVIDGGVSL